MSIDELVQEALNNKVRMDQLILKGDSLYICMGCGHVSDYWKPGGVCYDCEAEGERQQEFDR